MAQRSTGTPAGAPGEPHPRRALQEPGSETWLEAEPRPASGPESGPESELGPEPVEGMPAPAGVDGEARPPRPQMERTPAPASPAVVRPRIVDLLLGLHYSGLVAGAVGLASALLRRAGAKENLLAMMAESTVDEARKQQVADLVLYGTIGVVALLLIIQLTLVVRLAAGRFGARPGLVLVVVAQVLLYYVAAGIVRDTGWEGLVVQIGLGVQAATALAAAVLSWLPPVGRWLGRRSAARKQ